MTLFETFRPMAKMNTLAKLPTWYESQCNGDWEHQYGIKIETLDNPGWIVSVDLAETGLEEKPFQEISKLEAERDWIKCHIIDGKFEGVGSPKMLDEIIRVFLEWVQTVS